MGLAEKQENAQKDQEELRRKKERFRVVGVPKVFSVITSSDNYVTFEAEVSV